MFVQRLLSGIVMVIILAAGLILGGNVLFTLTVFISVVGFYEMVKATGVTDKEKKTLGGPALVGILGIIAYYTVINVSVTAVNQAAELAMLCIVFTILAILAVYVFTFPKYQATQVMAVIFAFVYAPVMLSYIYRTRNLENGEYLVWLIFVSSWVCDTAAYVVGKLFGKHKMTPKLSPKKSIEGGIGGIVGAALVGCLYGYILKNMGIVEVSHFVYYPLIAGVGGAISQVGDLAASAVKRNYEIKDYGHLIPGHGGILDRFDSVIFTAPMIYYLAVLLLK